MPMTMPTPFMELHLSEQAATYLKQRWWLQKRAEAAAELAAKEAQYKLMEDKRKQKNK